MKSHPQDSESVQPVSFGEILKIKEKQLQGEQEIVASSVAVALAAIQIPAIRLPMLDPGPGERSANVDTQADRPLEALEPRSSNDGMDQAPMRSVPDVTVASNSSSNFSGSGSLTDTQTGETVEQSLARKETSDAVSSQSIPVEFLRHPSQAVMTTETSAMPMGTELNHAEELSRHGLAAEILSRSAVKQSDNTTGGAKTIESPGKPTKPAVESKMNNVGRPVSNAKVFRPAADVVEATEISGIESPTALPTPSPRSHSLIREDATADKQVEPSSNNLDAQMAAKITEEVVFITSETAARPSNIPVSLSNVELGVDPSSVSTPSQPLPDSAPIPTSAEYEQSRLEAKALIDQSNSLGEVQQIETEGSEANNPSASTILRSGGVPSDKVPVSFGQNTVVADGQNVESQSALPPRENSIPSSQFANHPVTSQPDSKHEGVGVETRTTETREGVTVVDTANVQAQQVLTKNRETSVYAVSTSDARMDYQTSEVFTRPIANVEEFASAPNPTPAESLPMEPKANRKSVTAPGQKVEKQTAMPELSPEKLQPANQTGDGLIASEISEHVSVNDTHTDLAQSDTNETRLSSAALPGIQVNANHESAERPTVTGSIDMEDLQSAVLQNWIHDTNADEQKAKVSRPNSPKQQTVPYAVESTGDPITSTDTQIPSQSDTRPYRVNTNSENVTIEAKKPGIQNNIYIPIVENLQPDIENPAAPQVSSEAQNQQAAVGPENPTIVSDNEMAFARDRSVAEPASAKRSIEREEIHVDTRATAQANTGMPKTEKAAQSTANAMDSVGKASSGEIYAASLEHTAAGTPQSGNSTASSIQERESLTLEMKSAITQPAVKREVNAVAQEQVLTGDLPIQYEANQEKIAVETSKIDSSIPDARPLAENQQPAVQLGTPPSDRSVPPELSISDGTDAPIRRPISDTNLASPEPGLFKTDQRVVEQQTDMDADALVEFPQPPALGTAVDLKSQNLYSTPKHSNLSNVAADFVDANSPDSTSIGANQFVTNEQDNPLATETTKQSVTPEISAQENTQAAFDAGESLENSIDDVFVQLSAETKKGISAAEAKLETPPVASFESAADASPDLISINIENVTVGKGQSISQSDKAASIVETVEPEIKVSVVSKDSSEANDKKGISGTETQTYVRAEKPTTTLDQSKIDPDLMQKENEPRMIGLETEAEVSRVNVPTARAPQSATTEFASAEIATADAGTQGEGESAIEKNVARATVAQPESDIQPEQAVQRQNTNTVVSEAVEFRARQPKAANEASQLDSNVQATPVPSPYQSSEDGTETKSVKVQSATPQAEAPATKNADLPEVVSSQTDTNMGMPGRDVHSDAEQVTAMPPLVSEEGFESTTKIPFSDKSIHETSVPTSSTVNAETSVSLGGKPSLKVDHGMKALDPDKPNSTDERTTPIENQHLSTETVAPAPIAPKISGEAVIGHSEKGSAIQIDPRAAEVIEQVIHHLNGRLKSGPTSMHLHLNPKELGTIEVEMTRDSQGINVTFFAEQASTGRLLETQLSQLRQSLVDSGVPLSGLNIGQHSHSGQEGGFPNQNTDFAQHTSRQREAFQSRVNTEEGPRPERYTGQMSEVDYLI